MAVFKVKTYKEKIKNGVKVKIPKTKEELDRQTCKGTKWWYFVVYYIYGQAWANICIRIRTNHSAMLIIYGKYY